MSNQEMFSTGEAARLLGVSRSTVSRKFDQGVLRGQENPLTGERLISRESLVALMKQHNLPVESLTRVETRRVLLGTSQERLIGAVRQAADDPRIQLAQSALGADTLVACSVAPPNLVVLGEAFPDLTTANVIRSLRQRSELARIRILCCLETVSPDAAGTWGADALLTAPEWKQTPVLRRSLLALLGLADKSAEEQAGREHRRRWPRYPAELPARAGVYRLSAPRQHIWGSAVVRNLSAGGAFLSPLQFGEGVRLPGEPFRLLLEIDQPRLIHWRAYCQVVRLQSNGHLSAGVQFVRLSPADRHKLIEFVRAAAPAVPLAT